MDFVKTLKHCQYSKHMTNEKFAEYLGKSRMWLQIIYTTNPKIKKYRLSELTMFMLNEKLDIPMELMKEYNDNIGE